MEEKAEVPSLEEIREGVMRLIAELRDNLPELHKFFADKLEGAIRSDPSLVGRNLISAMSSLHGQATIAAKRDISLVKIIQSIVAVQSQASELNDAWQEKERQLKERINETVLSLNEIPVIIDLPEDPEAFSKLRNLYQKMVDLEERASSNGGLAAKEEELTGVLGELQSIIRSYRSSSWSLEVRKTYSLAS